MERGLEKEEYRNGTPSPFSFSRFFLFPSASSHVGRDHYLGLIELIINESAHSHHLPLALLVCLQLSRVVSRFLSAPHWALGNPVEEAGERMLLSTALTTQSAYGSC